MTPLLRWFSVDVLMRRIKRPAGALPEPFRATPEADYPPPDPAWAANDDDAEGDPPAAA